jgi:hypothetical protein
LVCRTAVDTNDGRGQIVQAMAGVHPGGASHRFPRMPVANGDIMQIRTRWLAIGSIVALAICSGVLSIATLTRFQGSSAGDLAATSTPGIWVCIGILLAVTPAVLGPRHEAAAKAPRALCAHSGPASESIKRPEDLP